ncbi:MAG: mechanosensitive ion channel family protein, partial [Candidatus Binatia bacterium]
ALIPVLRVIQPVMTPSIAALSWAICVVFAIDMVRQAYAGVPMTGQAILVLETLAAILVLFWMRERYRQIIAERAESRAVVLRTARSIILSILIISFFAGVAGYLRLARLLTPGVLVGSVLALAAFAYLQVFSGAVAVLFQLWPLRLLRVVEHHGELLQERIYRVLIWIAVLGWLTRYLAYVGLLDPAWSLLQGVLGTRLERGTLSISVSNVIEFVLTVWLAYLLSAFIRFVLQEDFYPRMNIAPGISYAMSSLLNYIVLALGFVLALGAVGVDFSKVTLLAGAFGVGIGFGLQSVVNNFVSGLILLFERPVHVGDAVQIGDLQGRVRRIGIRASVVRTLQGAEIIVPNAQLISEQVTNWTLSDQLRRVDLPVGVNYGAAPKKVIELLESVARAHPDVLKDPAPRCLFMSYGDSGINFELRVWADYINGQQVKSDLTVAIYDAVYAAGMSFPFPQREIRMLSDNCDAPLDSPSAGVKRKAGL